MKMKLNLKTEPWRKYKGVSPELRFWSNVKVIRGDCWEWGGSITKYGYGQVGINKKNWKAHRYSYELIKGKIPDGLVLDHICRNKKCVNPDHLEPVTIGENVLRGYGIAAKNLRKTHCKYGHEFNEKNTYIDKKRNLRRCRVCLRHRWRREHGKGNWYIKDQS